MVYSLLRSDIYIYGTPPQRSTCFYFLLVFTWFYGNFGNSSEALIFQYGVPYIYIYNFWNKLSFFTIRYSLGTQEYAYHPGSKLTGMVLRSKN